MVPRRALESKHLFDLTRTPVRDQLLSIEHPFVTVVAVNQWKEHPMALVPMFEWNEFDELPWPKPELRVVDGGRGEEAWQPTPARAVRRRPSAAVYRRRRAAVAGTAAMVVAGLLVGLWSMLPTPSPVGASVDMASGVFLSGTYTVQPGDTFTSIATNLAHGRAVRAVESALEAELGSRVVVPGEHIPIP